MDYPRRTMQTVKIMMQSLNLPSNNSFWSTISFYFILCNIVTMQSAHVAYMAMNIKDVTKMADTCSTISTTFQGILKFTLMYYNSKRVKKLFELSSKEFWPTYIGDETIEKSLNNLAKFTENLMLTFYAFITFCCCLLLVPPIFLGIRELPLASYYPFPWNYSPTYEVMYVWQWFINLYAVCYVVGSHDFLFVASMINLISQYRLLQFVLRSIGTSAEKDVYRKIILWANEQETLNKDKLLVKCVQHHLKLTEFCDTLQEMFSPIVCFQFIESMSGLCMGVFLVSVVNGVNFLKLIFFIIGHLAQLFLYCAVGNELMYQSEHLSDSAFDSGWYKYNTPSLRQGLILMIQQAQRGKKITALGMADLNILSFMAVIRSSISFSTLLKTMIEKQNRDKDNDF